MCSLIPGPRIGLTHCVLYRMCSLIPGPRIGLTHTAALLPCNMQHATRNMQHATCNRLLSISSATSARPSSTMRLPKPRLVCRYASVQRSVCTTSSSICSRWFWHMKRSVLPTAMVAVSPLPRRRMEASFELNPSMSSTCSYICRYIYRQNCI